MSKKHKKPDQQAKVSDSRSEVSAHAAEYSLIKRDLLKVVILNAVYLAGVFALYFTNSKTQYLEKWFEKVFHF